MAAQLEVAMGGGIGGMLQGGSAMTAWPASINKKPTSGAFWEEEVVQLMMGRPLPHLDITTPSSTTSSSSSPSLLPISKSGDTRSTTTLDLLGISSSSSTRPSPLIPASVDDPVSCSSAACCFDLDADTPLPAGWEKCLDLQTGSLYYLNRSTGLSTSCDPRKVTSSSVNWPTSPSSSDLTVEANVPMASSSNPISTSFPEGPSKEPTNLDLTLSLKPSSPCLRPHSLNHSVNYDLKNDFNHNFKSLISAQGPLNKQSFPSSLPLNSSRPSFALPGCASSIALSVSSPPSTLFFQEFCALKDMGSLVSSMSCRESKSMSLNQSLNGVPRHIGNNVSMSVREKPFSLSPSCTISKNFSVSAKANPIVSDIHMDASSPMMTVGCANCLMFVMLPQSRSPKCPRCGAYIDSDLPQPPSMKKPKLGLSLMS